MKILELPHQKCSKIYNNVTEQLNALRLGQPIPPSNNILKTQSSTSQSKSTTSGSSEQQIDRQSSSDSKNLGLPPNNHRSHSFPSNLNQMEKPSGAALVKNLLVSDEEEEEEKKDKQEKNQKANVIGLTPGFYNKFFF